MASEVSYFTVFDKNYLYQGLTLFNSLKRHSLDAPLYVLAMDDIAYDLLQKIGDPRLRPVALSKIESDFMKKVRLRMNVGQYCWTWQPCFAYYLLESLNLSEVVYLEADSMFFADPKIILESLPTYSATLAPHNYSPRHDQTRTSGKFVTHFNSVKNNKEGKDVLQYWRDNCLLYNSQRPEVYPGQKSLDSVPEVFKGVAVVKHPGAGLAPWNLLTFEIRDSAKGLKVSGEDLIFYHYHEFAWLKEGGYRLSRGYNIPQVVVEQVYRPYIEQIEKSILQVREIDQSFLYFKMVDTPPSFKSALASILPLKLAEYLRELKLSFTRKNRYLHG